MRLQANFARSGDYRAVKEAPILVRAWLPVILWSAIIAFESTYGSAANTRPLLKELAIWLFGHFGSIHFDKFHHILRKGGHFLGFGFLGYLCFRAFLETLKSKPLMMCAILGIFSATFVGALDEWHQSFVPGRSGQLKDVALDALGAVALVFFAFLAARRQKKRSLAA